MRWLAVLILALMPLQLFAQSSEETPEASEEDKGMLANFIEESLSGAGRKVEVIGLRGAISSEASLRELRISDDEGVWLSLSGVTLNWNRLAVLAGNFDVNQLKADRIVLTRVPKTTPQPDAPKAEATPFSLPELPVSINIQDLTATQIDLGEAVLGEALSLSLQARLILSGGDGEALLNATRVDGPASHFLVDVGYSNASRQLRLDLNASEAQGGIITTLAGIPGEPSIALTMLGAGPLDDFTADIKLSSDGQDRLAGQVVLGAQPMPEDETALMRTVSADLRGDIAPLFDEEYRKFFGTDIGLTTFARIFPDGRITLENLALWTAALNLVGDLELAANGMPSQFGLNLRMRDPENEAMLLPVAGDPIRLQSANLTASFDHDVGNRWTLNGTVDGLDTPAVGLNRLGITGKGIINPNTPLRVSADLLLDMAGLRMEDAGLSQAVGTDGTLMANLLWNEGADVEISEFELLSGGLVARGNATVSGLDESLTVAGAARVLVPDASRFSAVAGRDLGGELVASVNGSFAALDGVFDGEVSARTRDLTVGIAQVDALAKGEANLKVSAARTFEGINLREFALTSDAVSAEGQGMLSSEAGDVAFNVSLTDTSLLVPDISGPATVRGRAQLSEGNWQVDASATAPADSSAKVLATVNSDGQAKADFDLKIGKVELFVPSLPGSANVKGSASQNGDVFDVKLAVQGPLQSTLNSEGTIDPTGNRNALTLTGAVPLAAANPFLSPNSIQGTAQLDMQLNGALDPGNLTGTVSLGGGRFAMPALRMAFSEIGGTVTLADSVARVNMTTDYSGGGQIAVNGTVGIAPPFNANLPVQLIGLRHQEGRFIETGVDGTVTLSGPLTGGGSIAGDLVLGKTDVRISESALGGAAGIPDVLHIAEPGGSRTTRLRAGVLEEETSSGSSAPPFNLDISVRTGERINVSGLGLDTVFEGALTLKGTTADVKPEGGLEVTRGRMNFLGKTLEIDEGRVALAGGFTPTVRIVAFADQTDVTVNLTIEGSLDDLKIRLDSDPELPEDEVLSQLLFGRDISSISPLQALQLATTVRALSRGGGGGGLFTLTSDSGGAGLSTGGYLNDNLYTEIGVDSDGKSTIDLNLDVNDRVTIKGRVNSENETGVGIFYQHDY
ncbi:autotransporter secretion inner membrane protein TamB [Shimia isoporae]|uniref:Autotransporter secretion inner membrane protein TamB n=1 Tax=Shimia isoporae TaxID=647720 RepID=A0A4R1NCP0_9RHOB|nr:translocation/assembly module TamB domain-containing protein [Shimia isoporae]TCL01423.1 autotransporter secretion inner membrane protein TamB [Shimia isoporae]